jgi:hypothetical protein
VCLPPTTGSGARTHSKGDHDAFLQPSARILLRGRSTCATNQGNSCPSSPKQPKSLSDSQFELTVGLPATQTRPSANEQTLGAKFGDFELTGPRRLKGRSPEEAWTSRSPPTEMDRQRFQATIDQERCQTRAQKGILPNIALKRHQQAAVDRVALPRALVAHDYLSFTRRRIPSPIPRPKAAIYTKGTHKALSTRFQFSPIEPEIYPDLA